MAGTGVQGFSGILDFEFKPSLSIMAKRIDRIALGVSDFKVPLERAVREVMIPSIRRNFEVGGRPPWDPLADDTIERRQASGYTSDQILVRTGDLERGATSFSIWTITDVSATVRDLPQDIWYGKVHQAGFEGATSAGSSRLGVSFVNSGMSLREIADAVGRSSGELANIPPRPFILFQDEDLSKIDRIFAEWIGEVVAGLW